MLDLFIYPATDSAISGSTAPTRATLARIASGILLPLSSTGRPIIDADAAASLAQLRAVDSEYLGKNAI
jgi:hypothetical protein